MRQGFTLTEMMIVLLIIAIVATMWPPTFQAAVEQSRADIAAANLLAIWAAERVYWLEYHAYTITDISSGMTQLQQLQQMGVLDPAVGSGNSGGYTYTVNGNGTSFTATATRDTVTMTIDTYGNITATGIVVGFQ